MTDGPPEYPAFVPIPGRDAAAAIRGFVYQVERTIQCWVQLEEGSELHLEAGEDIDLVQRLESGPSREMEQVKNHSRPISLRSSCVLEFLGNFLLHRDQNPGINLSARLLTTAMPARERGSKLPLGMTGVDAWTLARDSRTSAEARTQFLTEILRLATPGGERQRPVNSRRSAEAPHGPLERLREFCCAGSDDDFANLVASAELCTGAAPLEEVRPEVENTLVCGGWVPDHTSAHELYNALFVFVIQLLASAGMKCLAPGDLSRLVNDTATTSGLASRFALMQANVNALRDRVGSLETRVLNIEAAGGHRESRPERKLDVRDVLDAMVVAGARGQSQVALVFEGCRIDQLNPPPALEHFSLRSRAVARLAASVHEHPWTHVTGTSGSGKTHLVRSVVGTWPGESWWVRLREVDERLATAMIRFVLGQVSPTGRTEPCCPAEIPAGGLLVLDDLPQIEGAEPLSDLLKGLLRKTRGTHARLVTIGGADLPGRILSEARQGEILLEQTPRFEDDEVQELLVEYGAPEHLREPRRASVINSVCQGHPELLVAAIRYLQGQGWRLDEKTLKELIGGAHAEPLGAGVLRRIRRTVDEEPARELLFRLTLADPPFSYGAVSAVAGVPDAVRHPGLHVEGLAGLWLQREHRDRFSVAPIVRQFGPRQLSPSVKNAVHIALANEILANQPINPFKGAQAVHHLELGGEVDRAGFLLASSLQAMRAQDAWTIGDVTLNLWRQLPPGLSPFMALIVRANQAATMAGAEHHALDEVVQDLRARVKAAGPREAPFALAAGITISMGVGLRRPDLAMDFLELAAPFFKYAAVDGQDFTETLALGASALGLSVSTVEDAHRWATILRALPQGAATCISEKQTWEDACLGATEQIWLQVFAQPEEKRDWEAVESVLSLLEEVGLDISLPVLYGSARRARVVVRAEFRKDIEGAVSLADEALRSICDDTVRFLVQECAGRQLGYAGYARQGLERLEQALSVAPVRFATVRFHAHLAAAASAGSLDSDRWVFHARSAVEIASREEGIGALNRVRAHGTLAIALWRKQGELAAWPALEDTATALLAVDSQDESWRDLLMVTGHTSGYLASLVATGDPPPSTANGEPYVAPPPNMFLPRRHASPGSLLPPREEGGGLCLQLALMAEALGLHDEEARWAARSASLARRAGSVMLYGAARRHVVCGRVTDSDFDAAFGAARESWRVFAAQMLTGQVQPESFFSLLPVEQALRRADRETLASMENAIAWTVAIPAIAFLLERWLAGIEVGSAVQDLLGKFESEYRTSDDNPLWDRLSRALRGSHLCSGDPVLLESERDSAHEHGDRVAWSAANLMLGMSPSLRPERALSAALMFAVQADRSSSLLGTSFSRIILPALRANWQSRSREQAFLLISPPALRAALSQTGGSPKEELRAIMKAAVRATGLRIPNEYSQWLWRHPSGG